MSLPHRVTSTLVTPLPCRYQTPIFAITPSEKSSINTNQKSTTRIPMSLRWSWYVAPKSPKGSQNAKRPIFV